MPGSYTPPEVAGGGGEVTSYVLGTDISLTGSGLSANTAPNTPTITVKDGVVHGSGSLNVVGTDSYWEFPIPDALLPISNINQPCEAGSEFIGLNIYISGGHPILAFFPLGAGTVANGTGLDLSGLTYLLASAV